MPVDVKFTSRSFLHFGLPLSPHNPSTPVSVTREHDSILSTLSSGQDEPSKFNTSSVQAMHPLRSMTWRNGRFTGSFCNAFVLRREQFLRESCANFWKIDYTLSHGKKWKPKMQGHLRVSVFKGWVMGKLTGCEYNFTGLVYKSVAKFFLRKMFCSKCFTCLWKPVALLSETLLKSLLYSDSGVVVSLRNVSISGLQSFIRFQSPDVYKWYLPCNLDLFFLCSCVTKSYAS